MVVRELITRFGFNVDTAAQNRVENSINRLSGLLSGLAAVASLRALANLADSMQSLEARIGMLPQTIGDVGAAFDEVAKNASANRQSLQAYGTLYSRIGNAAKDYISTQEDLLAVSNTISQALVVGGSTAQEAASVMTQFSQALGAGTLQGEEFRAMAEAAPQYMDALAEALGHPRNQLKKLASEGKITSKQVIEATLKMSSLFETKFKQMPMTIGQATTIIGNRFSTMVAKMNRESKLVTDVANFFLRAFDSIERGFNAFVDYVGGGTNALKLFGIALAAILGPLALSGLVSILGALMSPIGLVIGGLILLGLVIDDLMVYLDGGKSYIGEFIEQMKTDPIMGFLLAVLAFVSTLKILNSGILVTVSRMVWLGVTALATGAKIAAGWLIALGPIGLVIAAIAAIGTAIYFIGKNWDLVVAKFKAGLNWIIDKAKALAGFFGFGGASPTLNVNPSQTAAATAAGGGKTINQNNEINLTVPPGTPESQQRFLQGAAQQAFKDPFAATARDIDASWGS